MSLVIMPAIPEIILALLLMVSLMVGVFVKKTLSVRLWVFRVVGFALIATLFSVLWISSHTTGSVSALSGLFIFDKWAVASKIIILVSAIVVMAISYDYTSREKMLEFEYWPILGFAVLGMMVMASASDMMSVYLGIELQSLALYVLAAFRMKSIRSSEAGLKYFVLGALSSGLLLYGISMIYGMTGFTQFTDISRVIAHLNVVPKIFIVGLVLVITGLAFKVSSAPFHMWTPDVYEGVPSSVTVFFATAPKAAAMCLFVRILFEAFGHNIEAWQQMIAILSALSMLVGAFAGIVQTSFKRMIAYSSIGHVGFMLMGLASGTTIGVQALMIYLCIYILTTIGLFSCVLSMRVDGRAVEAIKDLAGLSKSHKGMALAIMIFMFSMAGIPPTIGFVAKFYVFRSAYQSGLLWLVILGALSSVVSAFYYLRIIKVMYIDEPGAQLDALPNKTVGIVMWCVAFLTLALVPILQHLTGVMLTVARSLTGG